MFLLHHTFNVLYSVLLTHCLNISYIYVYNIVIHSVDIFLLVISVAVSICECVLLFLVSSNICTLFIYNICGVNPLGLDLRS